MFVAAYGTQRLVPLLEVLDPATGLGPTGADDGLGTATEPGADRSSLLARLVTGAEGRQARCGHDSEPEVEGESGGRCGGPDGEVVLTDALVERLAVPSPDPPPRSAEIHVRVVRAESGQLRLAVCPYSGSQQAGSASGRYATALRRPLHPDDGWPDGTGPGTGPMIAEIVCRPADGAATALTAPAGLTPYRIALDVPPQPGDLAPSDLYLASTGNRLVVWAPARGRQVLPVVGHRAAPALLPPAARLLRLLGQAGTRPWRTWSWEPYKALPHTAPPCRAPSWSTKRTGCSRSTSTALRTGRCCGARWRAHESAWPHTGPRCWTPAAERAGQGNACQPPGAEEVASLCASDLIHLHVNRLLGVDPAVERLVRSLAADRLHRPS
ncbi:lantibiotic dehydratase [Streptomyces sp. NPDC059919]|uniref:lantibiotic dehydratase n=1 Tax=Streptomyces sp. NPDC059919 TaxID=3347004 RepID=UPI00365350B9